MNLTVCEPFAVEPAGPFTIAIDEFVPIRVYCDGQLIADPDFIAFPTGWGFRGSNGDPVRICYADTPRGTFAVQGYAAGQTVWTFDVTYFAPDVGELVFSKSFAITVTG